MYETRLESLLVDPYECSSSDSSDEEHIPFSIKVPRGVDSTCNDSVSFTDSRTAKLWLAWLSNNDPILHRMVTADAENRRAFKTGGVVIRGREQYEADVNASVHVALVKLGLQVPSDHSNLGSGDEGGTIGFTSSLPTIPESEDIND